MDRRIVIQQVIQGKGQNGAPTESWFDFVTVWANTYSGVGRELDAARQVSAEVTTQFQIRYIEGIASTMRIVWEGRNYDILHISEVGRHQRLNLFAKARQQ